MVYEVWCSWCGRKMGTKEGEENKFALAMKNKGLPIVSHSICPKCKKAVRIKYGFNEQGDNEHD
jgi:hypothetical protein